MDSHIPLLFKFGLLCTVLPYYGYKAHWAHLLTKLHPKSLALWRKYADGFDNIEALMEHSFVYFNTNVNVELFESLLDRGLLQHYKLTAKLFNSTQYEALLWLLRRLHADGMPVSIEAVE